MHLAAAAHRLMLVLALLQLHVVRAASASNKRVMEEVRLLQCVVVQ